MCLWHSSAADRTSFQTFQAQFSSLAFILDRLLASLIPAQGTHPAQHAAKVMYGHHVATLGLVSLSYFNGWQPIGSGLTRKDLSEERLTFTLNC